MKAPVQMTCTVSSRRRHKVRPHAKLIYRAHKQVCKVNVLVFFPTIICFPHGRRLSKPRSFQWLHMTGILKTPFSPAGCPCWFERCWLSSQSVLFANEGPAETGERRGFPAVQKQQAKNHHFAGTVHCCHIDPTEDSHKGCSMRHQCFQQGFY